MSINMIEIERALRALRLSGIRATLETRVLQAQANQEPFLDTFSLILQDELDRCRSRLMERRYQQSGLDECITLADFDSRFNPKLPSLHFPVPARIPWQRAHICAYGSIRNARLK
jgi:hypothetical protein